MGSFANLLANAAVAGLLLGGFYAAVAVGIEIAFGMLDIPNLAHPAFVILGAFAVWLLNSHLGLDPLLAGVLAAPVVFLLGAVLYQAGHAQFPAVKGHGVRQFMDPPREGVISPAQYRTGSLVTPFGAA